MNSTEALSMSDRIAVAQEHEGYASITREDAIKAIRTALKARTGVAWSVTGDRGTAYGWLTINAPRKRRTGLRVKNPDYLPHLGRHHDNPEWVLIDSGVPQPYGLMTPADIETLSAALGMDHVHEQGVSIAASNAHYIEFIQRAEGRVCSTHGQQYWD